ncbi:hypothetical protein CR513_16737, partial [Mucuna pruriens]
MRWHAFFDNRKLKKIIKPSIELSHQLFINEYPSHPVAISAKPICSPPKIVPWPFHRDHVEEEGFASKSHQYTQESLGLTVMYKNRYLLVDRVILQEHVTLVAEIFFYILLKSPLDPDGKWTTPEPY